MEKSSLLLECTFLVSINELYVKGALNNFLTGEIQEVKSNVVVLNL